MDRVDLALIAAVDEVLHHRVADLAVLGRGADHCHRLGPHDAGHRRDDVLLFWTESRVAPCLLANTGFRSISEISGKSLTSWLTRTIRLDSASRLTGSLPRTPLSIS